MVKITKMRIVQSIKPDPANPQIIKGTIQNPINADYVTITFEDGVEIQIERPLTLGKITAAYNLRNPIITFDNISTRQEIVI